MRSGAGHVRCRNAVPAPPARLLRLALRDHDRLLPRLRVGDRVLVSGTAPVFPDGSCPDDAALQTRRCFAIIETALAEAGAALRDVGAVTGVPRRPRRRRRGQRGARRDLRRRPAGRDDGRGLRAARPALEGRDRGRGRRRAESADARAGRRPGRRRRRTVRHLRAPRSAAARAPRRSARPPPAHCRRSRRGAPALVRRPRRVRRLPRRPGPGRRRAGFSTASTCSAAYSRWTTSAERAPNARASRARSAALPVTVDRPSSARS